MGIFEKKLKQLSKGLNKEKTIIKIYNYVRDLPYHLVPFENAEYILKIGFGDCRAKHDLLARFYSLINIPVKHIVMQYDWRGLPIPKNIIKQLKTIGTIWPHYALKIKIKDKWLNVDATWDSKLKKSGFPVNEHWDGKSNTNFITNNVTNIRTLNHIRSYVEEITNLFKAVTHVNQYFLFAEKLNSFLQKQREK